MNKNTENIDELIKESLSTKEAEFYDKLDEQNLLGMLGGLFRGKLSWLIVIMNIISVAGFILFIYCAFQFFNTDVTNELIHWAVVGFIVWSFLAMIKIFIWMQMHKNAQLRELKRLELQIATMIAKMQQN